MGKGKLIYFANFFLSLKFVCITMEFDPSVKFNLYIYIYINRSVDFNRKDRSLQRLLVPT